MFKLLKNDEAVSPIVATLVLIVVAIIGAAAVGMLMGTFSNDVSKKTNANDAGANSGANIIIAGSTTVYPASVILAKDYMASHPGVKVTVQQGGSDAGVAAAGMGIADIGAASRTMKNAETTKYPNLQVYQVGGSAVCFITGSGVSTTSVTKADLQSVWGASAAPASCTVTGVTMAVSRSDASGTEETVAKYLGGALATAGNLDNAYYASTVTKDEEIGNEGVLAKVQGTTGAIGFVDYGYVNTAAKLGSAKILTVDGKTPSSTAIKAELKSQDNTNYVKDLTRPLNYVTNGAPSSIVKDFITYAQSPAGAADFDAAGMFGITEFA